MRSEEEPHPQRELKSFLLYFKSEHVFLFVSVLIQVFLILTPSTWPLMDFFHLMTWNRCPIRFRHLSGSRDFPCSITLFLESLLFGIIKLGWFQDMLQWSRLSSDTVFFSHDATPFPSNLIDMNESVNEKLICKWTAKLEWKNFKLCSSSTDAPEGTDSVGFMEDQFTWYYAYRHTCHLLVPFILWISISYMIEGVSSFKIKHSWFISFMSFS